jgi:hypothetical protein
MDMAVLVIGHTFWFMMSSSVFFLNRYFWCLGGYIISDRQGILVGDRIPGS